MTGFVQLLLRVRACSIGLCVRVRAWLDQDTYVRILSAIEAADRRKRRATVTTRNYARRGPVLLYFYEM
jgi:hypothetical protein